MVGLVSFFIFICCIAACCVSVTRMRRDRDDYDPYYGGRGETYVVYHEMSSNPQPARPMAVAQAYAPQQPVAQAYVPQQHTGQGEPVPARPVATAHTSGGVPAAHTGGDSV